MPVRMRHAVALGAPDDFDGWRSGVRPLLVERVAAADVEFSVAGESASLFPGEASAATAVSFADIRLPAAFMTLARTAILHNDPERFALLYDLALGLVERRIAMADAAHPLIRRIEALAKSVRRDIHKMRAFVRFRELADGEGARFVAWFEPEHHIVRTNARFFIERFSSMRWSILTPALCIHWDGQRLSESPGATRADAPAGDPVEDIWKRYYASIFNPARVKIGAMLSEMPRKYWHNMPETALIPELIAKAQARTRTMLAAGAAVSDKDEPVRDLFESEPPAALGLGARETAMAKLIESARADLPPPAGEADYGDIVWGEGPLNAAIMLVGEQPGDVEDQLGRPFVGPAGQLLDRALAEARFDRGQAYLTNAFKRFKYLPRGKRRLHQSPSVGEIDHARWWLDRERGIIRPRLIIALGASAARGVLGKAMPVEKSRGQSFALSDGTTARITLHPSAILRTEGEAAQRERFGGLVEDLRAAAALVS
jgi:uracil-DNA glycosylase